MGLILSMEKKNIGLPKGKQPEDITKEQAIELINAKK